VVKTLRQTLLITQIILIYCFPAHSSDISDWVRESGRDQNSIIFKFILTEDRESSSKILKALGQRSDPYVEDIIESLFYQHLKDNDEENCLEELLRAVLAARSTPEDVLKWHSANSNAYNLLIDNLDKLSNPYLKSYIIRLFSFSVVDNSKSKTALMNEGRQILQSVKTHNGYLIAGGTRELLELLNAIESLQDPSFMELLLSFIEHSRQGIIVVKARNVLHLLKDKKAPL